jgi:predicted nucleic acid-binding Zn ribbon protein
MLVKTKDGKCRECGGQLEIVEATEDTLEVECTACGEAYTVETDAFGDGGGHYWPEMMAAQEFGEESEEQLGDE